MDSGSSSGASIGNEELDLSKFVAFKSLKGKGYLVPGGYKNCITFMKVDAISFGVKHEIQKVKDDLFHIKCCDANKYWSWGLRDKCANDLIAPEADQPEEDARACTLIKISQRTEQDVRIVNFKLQKPGGRWCSIRETFWDNLEEHYYWGDFEGRRRTGTGDVSIIDWVSIANKEMDLPEFVVFNPLSNKNYVCPSGVDKYMKSDAKDVVQWGVKHEVCQANYEVGLVHIKCCDSESYWSWSETAYSCFFITAQANGPGEDTRKTACTLIKPSHSHNTEDGVEVVNLEVMHGGRWIPVGVNDGGHLVPHGNPGFIMSKWESSEGKNTDTGGSGALIGNEKLDLPKFVAINSIMNKKYLIPDNSGAIKFGTEDVLSSSIKHEFQKAECAGPPGELIHIKCCDTNQYWSWSDSDQRVVALANNKEEKTTLKTCTLIKRTQYIKDGVSVVNLQISVHGNWRSIGGDGSGYLVTGGEDFIVSDCEKLQMGHALGPHGGCVAKSISIKLSQENYSKWKQQMLAFLFNEELSGYVDGTIKPVREVADYAYKEWKKLDILVREWILVTLTENILQQVTKFETAQEVWMELKKICTTTFQLSLVELIEMNDQKRGQIISKYVELHKAILKADWKTAAEFLNYNPGAVREPITSCSETALIVAIRSPKRNDFVKKLIKRMVNFPLTEDGTERTVPKKGALLAFKDTSGATALHAAVDGGNIEAAKLLLRENPELANIENKHGTLAVHLAAGLGNREMVELLLKDTTILSQNLSGLKFLHFLASSGLYDIAFNFLQKHPNLTRLEPSPLVVIAQQPTSFPSGTSLDILRCLIYSGISLNLKGFAKDHPQGRDIENNLQDIGNQPQAWKRLNALFGNIAKILFKDSLKKFNSLFWIIAEKLESKVLIRFNCRLIKSVRETKKTHYQALNLVNSLCNKVVTTNPTNAAEIFTEPLRNATRMGIHEIVVEILHSYPNAMHMRSEQNQSLFHLAIMYRHENIFNLIYQMEEDWRTLLSMPDASKNNALHLAGDLQLEQQLSLRASAAGAALQMQRELQWFKEVEKLILPQVKDRKNKDGKTPQELFTEKHKDLVEKGENWMKGTANSCSIVAALITTIIFAAAITVPGGSGGNEGLPVRLGYIVFTWFMVSNALAMFSSSTSLLIFLSILTSRYGEQDFLLSLPRRMILGLATLFLSIIFMMVAFAATLIIVSGKLKLWIIISVAILSFVPVTSFALLQLPLLYDMIKSTYFSSIGKRSNRTKEKND